ncbi:hypothetical protein E4655_21520, partial [Serratia marcescens]
SGTIHHSGKGSQYVSLAYTQRLQEAEQSHSERCRMFVWSWWDDHLEKNHQRNLHCRHDEGLTH